MHDDDFAERADEVVDAVIRPNRQIVDRNDELALKIGIVGEQRPELAFDGVADKRIDPLFDICVSVEGSGVCFSKGE